jgi:oxygen-independent coproporphyrinogen-3 oxidase
MIKSIEKYDATVPRYTSYPSAVHFSDVVPAAAILERIGGNNAAAVPADLSLYLHLPFCASLCWYCGCATVITRRQEQSAAYLRWLEREITATVAYLKPARRVVQVHLGGGTPTFLLPHELRALGTLLRARFAFAAGVEASAEIDPRRLTEAHVVALREAGFNRASIGVQDHNPVVQQAVNRIQSAEETAKAMAWLRAAGFTSINIDLIYGLPHQTVASFGRTLRDVLALAPDRLAVFSYAHVPWMRPAQRLLDTEALPDRALKVALLAQTIEMLGEAGYDYIGMDHFARPDDELAIAQRAGRLHRNFQGYTTHGDADLYGFGMSAISSAEGAYWQTVKSLPEYEAALAAGRLPYARGYLLTPDDRLRRELITRLMCDMRLDYAALSQRLGVEVTDYFASELGSLGDLEADGLVCLRDGGLEVTAAGRFLIRVIAMRFDAYASGAAGNRYSRAL